jgi:hypothetical protein
LPILDRVKKAWNAFRNVNSVDNQNLEYSTSSSYGISPSRSRLQIYNERSIVSSIYTRIGVDVAGVAIKHVMLDKDGRYKKDMESSLNDCLTLETNLDQGPRAFRQDIAMTLFDKGVAALVPVDTSINPQKNGIFDIYTLRVGEVVTWYPKHVKLSVYNENTGRREELTLEKRYVAIIENPLFAVMNEPNSTLQRLIRKLGLLDAVDEQSSSGKLDIIIQLPYVIKSEARRQQAEVRREDIEFQLRGSQYGIAYIDGTEKITQLNRPSENNLLKQVEYLGALLYNQLGLTEEVMNGTAKEEAMLNYFNRTIELFLMLSLKPCKERFLGPKLRRIKKPLDTSETHLSLFLLLKLLRLLISLLVMKWSHPMRSGVSSVLPPSSDPKADKLINSNMPQASPPNGSAPSTNGHAPKVEVIQGPNSFERNSQNGS